MRSRYYGFRNRLITLTICLCGVLAFSTTLSAGGTLFPTAGTFTLGNAISTPYYQVLNPDASNDGAAVPAGPYAGTLTGSPITLFFCLSGALVSNWDTSYGGTESLPTTVQDEEAAFLGSLFFTDAAAAQIVLTTFLDSNGKETLVETGPVGNSNAVPDFINSVQGPISMAIWQIMGSLPSEPPYSVLNDDPKAAPFVLLAAANYASYSGSDVVFVPTDDGIQSFLGVSEPTPEPGTMVFIGTGILLIGLGSARRFARRRR